MVEKAGNALNSIEISLKERPMELSEIAKSANVDPRTAERYLKLLEQLGIVVQKQIENKNLFFLKEDKNYFKLPVKQEHENIISTIYNKIKLFCQEKYFKEPTKTQVYKIIYLIDKKFELNLPIGWYLYGPCCIQPYEGNEDIKAPLKKELLTFIKETTEKYCQYSNLDLQHEIYQKEKNKLYLTKEKLLALECKPEKKILNIILRDLVKLVPQEAVETTTDFARVTLSRGWNAKTKDCFNLLWKFISTINFKSDLKYDDLYFEHKLNSQKRETQLEILNIFNSK